MRQTIKRATKCTVSIVLSIMMIVSMMLVGMVTTVNAVGAVNNVMKSGDTLYYNFGNIVSNAVSNNQKGVNYRTSKSSLPYTTISASNYIISATLTEDIDFSSYNDYIFKTEYNGWDNESQKTNNNPMPSNGQNMIIVSADDNSYTWGTYDGSSSGGETTYDPRIVAGSSGLCGSSWDPSDTANQMTTTDGITYTITYYGVSAGTYEFKVTDGSWTNAWPSSNKSFTISVKSDVTITFNNSDKSVSVSSVASVSEYKLTSVVNGQGTVSYKIDGTEISDLTAIEPNSEITVTATPATGYSLTSIVAGSTNITSGSSFTISSDTTVTVTFTLNAPTVSLSSSAEELYIGQSCDITASASADLEYTTQYTVIKDGASVNASTYIADGKFSTPCADASYGTYVITYTASITDNGTTVTDSESVTINVTRSDEQVAYNAIVTFLADTANDPDNMSGKKPSTLATYKTAYEAAEALVGTYPSADGTACQTAYDNLIEAYEALEDLISLAKPVLNTSADEIDLNSENTSLTLTVANASAYANANVTYTYYQNGEVLTTTSESSVTLELTDAGEYTYYVEVSVGDTDNYFCPDDASETKTVNAVKYYSISVDTVSNATIKVVNTSSTAITQALYGDTVQVQVTVTNSNYKCTGVSVSPSVSVTNNSDGTYKFTMPASDVTVTATVVEKTKYTVTASSNNTSWGTVSPETSTVYEGSTVQLSASTIGSNTFKTWAITGSYELASGSSLTSNNITIIVNGNITATATFEEYTGVLMPSYELYYSTTPDNYATGATLSGVDVYNTSAGVYLATVTPADLNKSSFDDTYYVSITKSTSRTDTFYSCTTSGSFKVTTDTPEYVTLNGNKGSDLPGVHEWGGHYFVAFSLSDSIYKYTVEYDDNTDTYTINAYSNVPTGAIKVYAKDGATLSGGTGDYGDTVLTSGYMDGTTANPHSYYDVYYVSPEGGIITIQTTVESTRHAGGYYVYAYVINGETVTTASKGNGVYESTYSVPANSGSIEITPVYYNKNIEADNNYITFYVDASELGDHWGNIVACYSYYYGSDGTKHGDGSYPGQPMLLNANGKYYTKLARYYYNSSGVNSNIEISGITLNNFYENDLHSDFLSSSQKKNYQSYDYDDFVQISEIEEIDTIEFEIKYRTQTSNQSTLNNGNTGASDTDSITISTFDNSSHNGWDDLTDYDGNLVDIQGNPVTDMDKMIYIVSTGNQSTSVGQWSTEWYVYDSSGTYITQGNPSDFIPRANSSDNTSAFNKMSSYVGYYTQICYESEMSASTSVDSGNSGTRCDGRWYYTNSRNNQAVIDTQIWYSDDNEATWSVDDTRTKGSATVDGEIEKTFEQRNIEANLNAVAGNGYVFVEWGIVDDNGDNYKSVSSSATTTFFVDTNYHLVAKFVKIQDNTLVLSHQKYAGPDAKAGFGFYYISAKHYDSNGIETDYAKTEGNITIPVNSTDDKIVITLTTTMSGVNTFIDWYEYTNDEYQIIGPDDVDNFGKQGTVSYEFTVSIADLYGDGVNELLVQTLNFFSDIAPVTADAVLNYKYYNRFGQERTYTVKTTLTDEYIASNGLKLTTALIYDNAPAIDDLHKDCKWQLTDQQLTVTGTAAVLWAVQDRKSFDVSIDDQVNPVYDATVYLNDYIVLNANNELTGVSVITDDYKFVTAEDSNASNQAFSYWLVTENGAEVARCYSKEFNLKIAGDYIITAIYGETGDSLTISDPIYSREQYTNADGSVVTDYLYVDFILAYMPSSGVLLNGVYGTEYTTGVIIEMDRYITLGVDDVEGNKLTDTQKKKFTDSQTLSDDEIKNFITTGSSSKVFDSDNDGVNNRALYNYVVDNSKYNNKNRLDYYIKYKNTATNRQYVYRAYYYVITPDNEVIVTDPVYFYLYDIGNSVVE